MRTRTSLVVALVAVAALAASPPARTGVGATGPAAAAPAGAATPTVNGSPTVTTGAAVPINETTILLYGSFEGADGSVEVYFQYRELSSSAGEWRRTEALPVAGDDRFFRNVTGLEPATTYEYRAVLSTSNGTWRGTVRTANTTGEETPTRTRTPTPYCLYTRGAGSLCTGTPTPTPEVDIGPPTDEPAVETSTPAGWMDGLVPVVAWVAVVAVLAPLVLGGLVGLDSLRGDGSE